MIDKPGQSADFSAIMSRLFHLTAFLALAFVPVFAWAQDPDVVGPRISAFRAGIFCAPEVVGTADAPGTVAGVTNIIDVDPPFVSLGRAVPAVLGMGFGVKSTGKGGDITNVLVTTLHPPMGPEGVTQQTYTTNISGFGNSLTLYQFDYDYELVPGLWSLTAMAEGEILFRASFTVVPPEMVPELASVCGYEDLIG